MINAFANETSSPIDNWVQKSHLIVMGNDLLFSRGELAAISGVPDEAVQFWLRHDLLRSLTAGDRKHRRFTAREVKLAALLGEARSMGLNIAVLKAVGDEVRAALDVYDRIPAEVHSSRWQHEFFSRIADDVSDAFSSMVTLGHMQQAEADRLETLARAVGSADLESLLLATDFVEATGVIAIYRDDAANWVVTSRMPERGLGLPSRSMTMLDLGRILDLRWPQSASDRP